MTFAVTTQGLAFTLDIDPASMDTDRAQFLLDEVTSLAESIVSPLPDAASAVVYTAAARAYVNPLGVTQQTVGPESVAYGTSSGSLGVYLTTRDEATLRRLAGSGGAFSIDTTPVGAGRGLPWWDRQNWGNPYDGDFYP